MEKKYSSFRRFLWKIKVTIEEFLRCCSYRKILKKSAIQYQEKYNDDQCCFVIGNGPSLNERDLDKLAEKGYVSFAANRIFKVFGDTKWRPTYYAVCDTSLFKKSKEDIDKVDCVKFVPLDIYDRYVSNKGDYNVFSRVPFTFFNRPPKFSNKIDQRFGEGGTITYHLLQLAVSMGFKCIYLIGVDFNFSFGIGPDGKYFEDKSIKQNHLKQDSTPVDTMPNLYLNLRAYQAANLFAKKHGIHIFNATRGGKLEVFDRIDLDQLLK